MPIANCYKYDEKIIPFRKHESEIRKNAKVKIFADKKRCKIICWNKPMYIPDGYTKADIQQYNRERDEATSVPLGFAGKKKEESASSGSSEKNRADSIKRAKDKIFEIALANEWEYMVTLTLDDEKIDRYDPAQVQKTISKWLDNQVQRKGIKYLIVPEYHKDKAIHFHGLVAGDLGYTFSNTYKVKGIKKPVKKNTLTRRKLPEEHPFVKKIYNVRRFPYGFTTAVRLDDEAERVAVYMTKYITKDLQKIFGSYYKAGGKIKRELDYILMNIDFVQMLDFENCTTAYLPDDLGAVRYASTDVSALFKLQNKSYDVYNDGEGNVVFIDEDGVVGEVRSAKKC